MPFTSNQTVDYEFFLLTFGEEIKDLAEWLNHAPESVDVEAAYETLREDHEFDCSDDGTGEIDAWVQEAFEDWSPRLRAARIAREAA